MSSKFSLLILGLVAVAKAQEGYRRDDPLDKLSYDTKIDEDREKEDEISPGGEIPGEAGKDYPIFGEIRKTRFDCGQQIFPGYYADTETGCQIFHICQIGGYKNSFLCPNGTIFNQEKLVCDWWFNFQCNQAENFYSINELIFRAMQDAGRINQEENKKSPGEYSAYDKPNGSRNQLQQLPLLPSSVQPPQSDFDSVVIEAARTTPGVELSREYETDKLEAYKRQEIGKVQSDETYAAEENRGNYLSDNKITGANFRRESESDDINNFQTVKKPAREYLPAKI